jgi:hypothetical protein
MKLLLSHTINQNTLHHENADIQPGWQKNYTSMRGRSYKTYIQCYTAFLL